ncbi:MAG: hypothetical protein L3J97_00500, partial [Thermoplasmata archaeon]|nr:hypothetical protein [Thermoplasmata archaeon]
VRRAPPGHSAPMVGVAATDPGARRAAFAIELLRIGVGILWALNLIFVVAPANDFFGNFGQIALSFGPTTLGGPALAQFVAAHATVFSWVVALLTGYLAVAFLLGLTTRWACFLGGIFSAVLLGVQVGSTFVFPGGTDVGEHPLYMLLYVALVVGGAGQALSTDRWIAAALARRRARRAAPAVPTLPGVWAGGLNHRFFVIYFVSGILIAFGMTVGLMVVVPSSSPPAAGPTTVSYVNLTVSVNPANGWPQYSPANFSVPTGIVVFTITDLDMMMNWTPCPCVVTGTDRSVELVNGTPVHIVPSQNVAHSFNIPNLGLSAYIPGLSVVRFTVDLNNPGSFEWICVVPCGTGTNAYTSPPMGVAGYMTGTMTIT